MTKNREENIEENVSETTLLEWTAPEFIEYSRSTVWYILFGIGLSVVFIYSIFKHDWIMAVLTVLFGVALFLYTRKKAKDVTYRITSLGVYCNEHLYPFDNLQTFWLNLNDEQRILNLIFREKLLPAIQILFYGIEPETIKKTLTKYIPELENHEESMADKLSRILKI
jgi:hypothetical protein